ncbi:MAG: hypothetical protein WC388_07000, partial [Bacteroidales bacterium]
ADETAGLYSSGIEVLPGTYHISMAQNVKGVVTELVGPVSFEVKSLNNQTLPAKDRSELIAFRKKAVELNGAISAVASALNDMNAKIAPWKAAAKVLRGQESVDLLTRVTALEKKLEELQLVMNGDRDRGTLDLDGDVALRRRAGMAMYGIYGNFSDVPGTAKKQYEIAAEEFKPLYEKTKQLMEEFSQMDRQLGEMGAPLTPGRLPEWK